MASLTFSSAFLSRSDFSACGRVTLPKRSFRQRCFSIRAEVEYVSADEATELVAEGYAIVDVRDKTQFERAHIKSCYHVPLFIENQDNDLGTIIKRQAHNNFAGLFYGLSFTKPNPDFVQSVKTKFSPESKILLVCQEGLRSTAAARKLEQSGFQNVACITSGLQSVKPGTFESVGSTELQNAGKAGLVTIQGKISVVLGTVLVCALIFISVFPDQAEQLLKMLPTRFHQLPEFDQGKRSCRRRLAGHNERRRKPPPGSLLSSRLGRLSSSLFGDSTTRSGFLLDFSSYSRNSERELWPGSTTSEAVSGIQSSSLGKFHHNLWPGNSENPPSEMYLQNSAGGTSYPIPSGECITGVSSDSTCALSLLSNQTWGSSNGASDTRLGNLMNHGGASVSQHTPTQTVTVAHLPNIHEADIGLHGASSDHLGSGQFSHPLNSDHLFMEQVHGGRHYMEVDHSNGYSSASASHVHWSL